MTTLTIMKARIADELARDDLTSQIAYAITDAIGAYDHNRFFVNDNRSLTVATVASQEFYTSSDAANLANVLKIDYVTILIGSTVVYRLLPMTPAEIELHSQNATVTGQPTHYCWYPNSLRLYPVPSDAWTVRIGCSLKYAAPATDGEASNFWMTTAERLIRSRAKFELATHVLKDKSMAADMAPVISEAMEQLRTRTANLTRHDNGRVLATEF